MVAFPNVRPGDKLYQTMRCRTHAGGTRSLRWEIEVVSVDYETRTAVVRVDGGMPKTVTARLFAELTREKAEARRASDEPRKDG